jgi:hypothetical protein
MTNDKAALAPARSRYALQPRYDNFGSRETSDAWADALQAL